MVAPTAVEQLPADGGASVCTATAFSVDGLSTALKTAINYMTKADLFEFALQLTKALQLVYEHKRQYAALALLHKNSAGLLKQIGKHDCWLLLFVFLFFCFFFLIFLKKIVDANRERSRHLGRYFRVGLYGSQFGELNGVEFIYKEPKLTHLFAFSDRLREQFARRFGVAVDDINIVKDSKRVAVGSVKQDQCSVQLTLVSECV